MAARQKSQVPGKTVGRLGFYRRIISQVLSTSLRHMHSHEIARRAGVSAAQVRRDLMVVGFSGNPKLGYELKGLHKSLSDFLDGADQERRLALVGVGNLGKALLSYFSKGKSNMVIAVAFDADPEKAGRLFNGCRCCRLDDMQQVLRKEGIKVAVLAVPAEAAQGVAARLVAADVRGILNFAPVALQVPASVYVENVDVTMYLEKVAFFGRQKSV